MRRGDRLPRDLGLRLLPRSRRTGSTKGEDPDGEEDHPGLTFARCTMEEKNAVSHRGKALAEVAAEFDKILLWLGSRLAEEKPPKPDHKQFEGNDWSS